MDLPKKIERRTVDSLIPYARNSRTHSDEQVAQIAASMREWGWTNPVLITKEGTIVAGHGRVMAAQKLGLKEVPCIAVDGWTDAQIRAYVIADNRLAENAGWDLEKLAIEIEDLRLEGFDIGLTGFDDEALEAMFGDVDDDTQDLVDGTYTRKVVAPIYEVKGEKPSPDELYDHTKTTELLEEIEAADMPDDVRAFLRAAATRHTVFHFGQIAEFYAAAPREIQHLMERSALVIIDFDKAIEEGFVKMTKAIQGAFEDDYPEK